MGPEVTYRQVMGLSKGVVCNRVQWRAEALHLTPPMAQDDFARARRALMRRDPILAPVIRRHRTRSLLDTPYMDPFPALVRTITAQQISTKAAATIHGRLVALMPRGVTPNAMLALTDEA